MSICINWLKYQEKIKETKKGERKDTENKSMQWRERERERNGLRRRKEERNNNTSYRQYD